MSDNLKDEIEDYEIQEDHPDHYYRTEIPNIVFELDLTPFEFRIYCQLKKISGDSGFSICKNQTLADLCQCSRETIKRALSKLESTFELIGKPLIKRKERFSENGDRISSLITIVPIWRENGNIIRSRPISKKWGVGSHRPKGWVSKTQQQEDPSLKNKNNKQEHVVVSFEKEKREALSKFKLTESTIQSLLKIDLNQINEGILAFEQYSRDKKTDNPVGFLVQAINSGWKPNFTKKDRVAIEKKAKLDRISQFDNTLLQARKLVENIILKEGYSIRFWKTEIELKHPNQTICMVDLFNPDAIDLIRCFIQTNGEE